MNSASGVFVLWPAAYRRVQAPGSNLGHAPEVGITGMGSELSYNSAVFLRIHKSDNKKYVNRRELRRGAGIFLGNRMESVTFWHIIHCADRNSPPPSNV